MGEEKSEDSDEGSEGGEGPCPRPDERKISGIEVRAGAEEDYRQIYAELRWKARMITSDEDLIEEAVQETIVRYLERLGTGEVITNPHRYRAVMLRNALARAGKSKSAKTRLRTPVEKILTRGVSPERDLQAQERRRLLHRANAYVCGALVPRLSPEEQTVFVRCELQGETIRVAAQKLGLGPSKVQRRLAGAKAQVERCLGQWWRANAGSGLFEIREILDREGHRSLESIGELAARACPGDLSESAARSQYLRKMLGGRYRLDERVMLSSVGETFRGLDCQTGWPVHVEVLHRHIAMEEHEREAFLANGVAAEMVESPALLRPLAFGTEPCLYTVYPPLPARCFLEHVASADWTALSLLIDLLPVFHALSEAHRIGLVHGDLHSGQIYLVPGCAEASLRLFELGASPYAGLPRPRWFVPAQPAVRPPELRDPRQPSGPLSDVWSAMMLLYEALMWKAGGSIALLMQAGDTKRLLGVRELDPLIPDEVAFWIDAALRMDPGLRPDMESLLRGLYHEMGAAGFGQPSG